MKKVILARGNILVKINETILPVTGISLSALASEIAQKNDIKHETVLKSLKRYLKTRTMPQNGTIAHTCVSAMQKIFNEGYPNNAD